MFARDNHYQLSKGQMPTIARKMMIMNYYEVPRSATPVAQATETIVNSTPLAHDEMPAASSKQHQFKQQAANAWTIPAPMTTTTTNTKRFKSTKIRRTLSSQGLGLKSASGLGASNAMAKQPRLVEMRNKLRFETNLIRRGFPILLILVCSLIIVNTKCDQVGSANVQKFHPNGRYGRRSVDNFAESRAEFGKLVNNEPPMIQTSDPSGTLRSILRDINHDIATREARFGKGTRHTAERVDPLIVNNNQIEPNKLLRCNYIGVANLYVCDSAVASATNQ